MRYELFYWPNIQGRGEFIRLALEAAGADYLDVARERSPGQGPEAMLSMLADAQGRHMPFAPPFLRVGKRVLAQTANILHFLGPRLGLVPRSEAARIWAHQLQLTVADFVSEIHDTHHPISSGLYYEQQKPVARRRARHFLAERLPKYLRYFGSVLTGRRSSTRFVIGRALSYVDLSLFQLIAGLRYAYPRRMADRLDDFPELFALHDRVAARPEVASYLGSRRRVPFNEDGIFRHYPELDR